MELNLGKELARMQKMTVPELRERYAQVFGESTRAGNKVWLVKRIAWRLQSQAEGDLSERARKRAAELANDADLRMNPPRQRTPAADATERTITVPSKITPNKEMLPGTVLQRDYKGQPVRVTVLAEGFEYAGEQYRSLTAIAKVVTGKHWNGFHFFGLRKKGGAQ